VSPTTEQPQTKSGSKDDPKPDATGKPKADAKEDLKPDAKPHVEGRLEVDPDGRSTGQAPVFS
jgi:hypothetical protein